MAGHCYIDLKRVNKLHKQHEAAVRLLKELALDTLRMEPGSDGRYRFVAWNLPLWDGKRFN
jgi:uncharacterized protein YggL (DUF469 family)